MYLVPRTYLNGNRSLYAVQLVLQLHTSAAQHSSVAVHTINNQYERTAVLTPIYEVPGILLTLLAPQSHM